MVQNNNRNRIISMDGAIKNIKNICVLLLFLILISKTWGENHSTSDNSFPNKLKFTEPVRYDSLTNTIKVYWKLDSAFAVSDTMHVGITYSFDSVQVFGNENVTINSNGKFPDSGTVNFKLPELQFEKKYWVGLWLTKKGSGYWAPPTIDCLGTCSIPSFTRQIVTYFEPGKDTVFANNRKIRLWTEISDNPTTDTLKINPVTSIKGFVVVNPGFYFSKKENTRGFYVGLSYASLPLKYNYSQVRFFRGDSSFATVDTNPPSYDTLNKYVYINTNDLNDPFMLLIDTVPPNVIAPSRTITAAYQKSDIQDNFRVSDNVNNVKWSYFYSANDGKGKTIDGYFNASRKDTTITIPKENVGNETGVRIILKVTDGTHTVSYNLSRRILVAEADGFYINPQKWTPVSTNFDLDETSVSELILKKLKSTDSLYDKRYTRIFQWLPTVKNATSTDKWVEYSSEDSAYFNLTPGKTIWLKTRIEKIPGTTENFVTFSGAKTISLRDTFSVKLKPNSFNDISVPFHFNVRLSDVLNATQKADSLSFFIWEKQGKDSVYNATAFYLKNVDGANNKDAMIDFQRPFTVMNNSRDTVTLRFPPVSYLESLPSLSKPVINPNAWSVIVKALSDNSESNVYYGYVPGEKTVLYPDAPTFLQKRITLFERTSKQQGCYMVTGTLPNGGFSKEISLINKSDTAAAFRLTAETNGNFPADYKTVFYNRSSNQFSSNPEVTVAANSTETIWVISATNAYIDNYFNKVMSLTYALGSLYPNPCRGILNIPYVIPFGTSDQIVFEIFDELGRLVWKKSLESNRNGLNRFVWDGKGLKGQNLSAGFYLMRFTSRNGSGKVTSQFHSKFTYLP